MAYLSLLLATKNSNQKLDMDFEPNDLTNTLETQKQTIPNNTVGYNISDHTLNINKMQHHNMKLQ